MAGFGVVGLGTGFVVVIVFGAGLAIVVEVGPVKKIS